VGHFAIQLAKWKGAKVFTTTSTHQPGGKQGAALFELMVIDFMVEELRLT
jgi:NADPH:quinone reductase-like Zn-dependent oxidoreductase